MRAEAGTTGKSDALVIVENSSDETTVTITSPVSDLFGSAQMLAVTSVLEEMEVTKVRVEVRDNQAIDPVLCARTAAALLKLKKTGG